MKYSVTDHALIGFCVLSLACGQLVFKFVGMRLARLTDLFVSPLLLTALAGAIALYGASTMVWIVVLRRVPLSYAYMFMALGFLIVPLASWIVFKEPVSLKLLIGSLVVIVGLAIAVA